MTGSTPLLLSNPSKAGVNLVSLSWSRYCLSSRNPSKRVGQLPRTLLHEGRGGMRRDPGNLHTPGGQLHHEEHIVGDQARPGRHLHREEVRRREHFPVQLEELRPAHAPFPPLRRGVQMVPMQDFRTVLASI